MTVQHRQKRETGSRAKTSNTHRVGAVHDEPLQQDARDLLLDHLRLRLGEQVQQHAAEVVRVLVGVPELVRHGVQEEVAPLGVELVGQLRFGCPAEPRHGDEKPGRRHRREKKEEDRKRYSGGQQ